jgi:hypothetical protein
MSFCYALLLLLREFFCARLTLDLLALTGGAMACIYTTVLCMYTPIGVYLYVYVKLHGEYAEKAYLSHHLDLITAGAKSSYKFTPGNINRAPSPTEFILCAMLIFTAIA